MYGMHHVIYLFNILASKFIFLNIAFFHKGLCQLDTGSEADMEAAIDPLLCHYQGPISSLLRRGNLYGPEPTDTYTGSV